MGERLEIEIPPQLTEPLLQYASETELPVEEIVETALRNYLERSQDNPNISEVFLCMDSDEPGQTAAKRISDKLFTQGINAKILVPEHKDWNEDLLALNQKESEVEEQCQVLQL